MPQAGEDTTADTPPNSSCGADVEGACGSGRDTLGADFPFPQPAQCLPLLYGAGEKGLGYFVGDPESAYGTGVAEDRACFT